MDSTIWRAWLCKGLDYSHSVASKREVWETSKSHLPFLDSAGCAVYRCNGSSLLHILDGDEYFFFPQETSPTFVPKVSIYFLTGALLAGLSYMFTTCGPISDPLAMASERGTTRWVLRFDV